MRLTFLKVNYQGHETNVTMGSTYVDLGANPDEKVYPPLPSPTNFMVKYDPIAKNSRCIFLSIILLLLVVNCPFSAPLHVRFFIGFIGGPHLYL